MVTKKGEKYCINNNNERKIQCHYNNLWKWFFSKVDKQQPTPESLKWS